MTESEFKALACHARRLSGDYATGYQRGLRRHFHGVAFGLEEQHALWSRMGLDGDPREEMGRGYRDGIEGKPPEPRLGRPPEIESGRRVNLWLDAASVERAEALGGGNVSAGVRKALATILPADTESD